MAIAFVQAKAINGSSTAPAVTLDAAPTNGNLLVCFIGVGAAQATMTITGWTPGTLISGGSGGSARAGRMFYKIASGDSATVTGALASSNEWVITVAEYSGVDATTPLLVELSQLNISGVNTTPSVTPTGGLAAVVCCGLGVHVNTVSYSAEAISGTGIGTVTERTDTAGASTFSACSFDGFTSSTSGAYQGSGTPSAAGVGVGAVMVFRAAAAAAAAGLYPFNPIPFQAQGRNL